MTDDDSTPFDVDLETAYRQALQAVSATDLSGIDDWNRDTADDDEPADILPFPAKAEPAAPQRPAPATEPASRVTPKQIIEAALFVGGVELSGAKLAALLKGDFTAEFVRRTIDELNRRYATEGRPYEIRCDEGLYRLGLRPEHETLRRRVYGLGPKEVKLSQDALEVLSLVAYRQPIARSDVETLRDGNAGQTLRQLVRRQLVAVGRGDGDDVVYTTTTRFLEVFGVASLDELPRGDDRGFK